MHTNPFENARKGKPLSKEELKLKFDFDDNVDYFEVFEKLLPNYTPPSVTMPSQTSMVASPVAISSEVLREVVIPGKVTIGKNGEETEEDATIQVLGHRRYVPAVDPAGGLMQLTIAGARPDADNPRGFDPLYETRQVTLKSRKGWLIVDRDPSHWSPFAPYKDTPNRYAAWCFAIMAHRRAKYNEANDKETAQTMDRQMAVARETAKIQGAVTATAMKESFAEMRRIDAEERKAEKAEKAPK